MMDDPLLRILLAWILFAVTHVGLTVDAVRQPIVARFGAMAFSLLFSLVASVTFAILVNVYANAADQGPPGLALGATALRWPLVALSVAGVVCIAMSLVGYPTSAYAISIAGKKPEPRGFERITRHGFMFGLSMVAAAHALLAMHRTGTVFFACLAVFPILGSLHQDAKLRARNPELHGAYVARTSLVPFAAILAGRNHLVLSELRPLGFVLGLIAAWGLREAHPFIFADGGIYVIAATVLGAGVAGIADLLANRKPRRRAAAAATVDDHLHTPA